LAPTCSTLRAALEPKW